jgi:hypothetical protein
LTNKNGGEIKHMKQYKIVKEVLLNVPKITEFIGYENIDCLCNCFNVEPCNGKCEDCIFSKQNFKVFKELMNEKILPKQSDETREKTDSCW